MILELAGIITGGVTIITVASLRLVSVLDKREREEDDENNGTFTDPTIFPFVSVNLQTRCPHCDSGGTQKHGPRVPTACTWDECVLRNTPHLHMSCMTCKARWPMAKAPEGGHRATPTRFYPKQTRDDACALCGQRTYYMIGKACSSCKLVRGQHHLHWSCSQCDGAYVAKTAS